ncbi:hypothetical protein WIN67_12905 [Pseudomonas idahonensis]|uniref:hypothetical protein n=1 Tax=Pseudomonas idahonensis TaxID=2942628 RepID=UPI0030D2451B
MKNNHNELDSEITRPMYPLSPYHGFDRSAPTPLHSGRGVRVDARLSLSCRCHAPAPHEVHEDRAAVIGVYFLDRPCP